MSVEEIKAELATLPRKDQDEVVAFLFRLRHADDSEYQTNINRRLDDHERSHWLSPDEFEHKLDKNKSQ